MLFRSLVMSEKTKDGSKLVYDVKISGKATGNRAESEVEKLAVQMRTHKAFGGAVEKAKVTMFVQDMSPGAKKTDRLFEIECTYKPRTI